MSEPTPFSPLPPPPQAAKLAAGAATHVEEKKPDAAAPPAPKKSRWPSFFIDDGLSGAIVANEEEIIKRHRRLLRALKLQTGIIVAITLFLLLAGPMFRPIHYYYVKLPGNQVQRVIPLSMSNQTARTVMAWAANSITEIMTFGFGDFDRRLLSQRHRFTEEGWKSFVKAIIKQEQSEKFKSRQLVLTSVPADTPVITSEGPDEEGVYQWVVEMPIIMTFATNNNKTDKRREIIKLTIVRVPPAENKGGIAIKNWGIAR